MNELEQRIEELEIHNAHLQHQLDALDQVVQNQSKELDRFRRDLQKLTDGLESLGEVVRESPANGMNR